MEFYSRVTRIVTESVVLFLFAAVLLLQMMNIVLRYTGLKPPLMWVEEFSTFSFIWIFFLLWHLADRDGTHFEVDVLVDALSGRMRWVLEIFRHAAALVFAGVVVWSATRFITAAGGYPTNSFKWLTMGVVYTIIPVGLGLVFIERMRMLVSTLRRGA